MVEGRSTFCSRSLCARLRMGMFELMSDNGRGMGQTDEPKCKGARHNGFTRSHLEGLRAGFLLASVLFSAVVLRRRSASFTEGRCVCVRGGMGMSVGRDGGPAEIAQRSEPSIHMGSDARQR